VIEQTRETNVGKGGALDSAERTELSILVQSYGDCTQSRLGVLSEMETHSLLEVVFFGESTFSEVAVDASGNVTPLETEAVHHLFNVLSGSTAFKDIFVEIMSRCPVSVATVTDIVSRRLGTNDPATAYVDSFVLTVMHILRTLFDNVLFPELESSTEARDNSHAVVLIDSNSSLPGARRGMPWRPGVVPQLLLSQVLSTYCDFRDAKSPSLSLKDKEHLRLRYLWGKDMRSISRATDVTYQRVQQLTTRADARLLADLQEQESFVRFWEQLQKFCVVSPATLTPTIQSALGDTADTVDVSAIAQFLMSSLKSSHLLATYSVGRRKIQYARGTLGQLTAILGYLRELGLYRGDSAIGAATMFVMSHSDLPSACVPGAVSELLSALPDATMADRIGQVMRSCGSPCHYSDIARALEEKGLATSVETRQVLSILGRDLRFTWAGLGTYALREWGYPAAGSTLDVVVHMIRTKGGGVTLNEIREFLFVEHKYCVKETSVRAALKQAEGKELVRIGNGVWDELHHGQQGNEVTEHE
jgi:hypothetical protein